MSRLLSVLIVAMSCWLVSAADSRDIEFFEKIIRPLLAERCYGCHSASAGKTKGGLSLDTRAGWQQGGNGGPAIFPGAPSKSLLLTAVSYTDPEMQMPPKSHGGKLSDQAIAALTQWIQQGAVDPREGESGRLTGLTPKARNHWAFQPVKKPSVPVVANNAWVRTPVDNFVLAKLIEKGLRPSEPASKETLLRRVTYDLIGLPPTEDEIKAFIKDTSADAFAKVVDRLLASPQYGERWGRHWLDTARYADTMGIRPAGKMKFSDYRYPYAWTYRDYVIKAFNEDKPYNVFLLEQLAADLLPDVKSDDPRLAALGFITVGKRFDDVDDIIDERIDTVSKATLGLTVSCSRCHDHKFDPIPTADYYSLHGIFASTIEPVVKPELKHADSAAERAEFNARLAELEKKNRDIIYGILREHVAHFQTNAEGYLMLFTEKRGSTARYEIAKRYNIHPENREVVGKFRQSASHPVLGPYFELLDLPQNGEWPEKAATILQQAVARTKTPLNRQVAEILRDLKPRTIQDVAAAYGSLFKKAQAQSELYIRAQAAGQKLPATIDSDLVDVLETPYAIPPADAIATTETQAAFFIEKSFYKKWQVPLNLDPAFTKEFYDLLFPAINELRLTHAGAPPKAMLVNDAPKPTDSFVHIRGERERKGPVVPRRFLEVLRPSGRMPYSRGSGRLELAQDIIDPRNPLTARVLVNRVWMHHFGEGFVRTPDDFGNMSEPPTHPELLDWLAATFVENGWSIKALHRKILLSNAYQQCGQSNPALAEKDADNRYLWRANLRRLDFEAIRDSMLLLAGKLDRTIGGKPCNITDEPFSYRRSVYGYVDRANLSDLMRQFDFSDPDMANSRRVSSIVPQQALFFMNSPMSVDVARQISARPDIAGAMDTTERVRAIYRVLFQRAPTNAEVLLAETFINTSQKNGTALSAPSSNRNAKSNARSKQTKTASNKLAAIQNAGSLIERRPLTAWEMYIQALLCSNEFVYVE